MKKKLLSELATIVVMGVVLFAIFNFARDLVKWEAPKPVEISDHGTSNENPKFLPGLVVPAPHVSEADLLVQQYPAMRKVCALLGSCATINLTCTRYDNKSNSSLRNSTWWDFSAVYPKTGETIHGYGYAKTSFNVPSTVLIHRAIKDWLKEYREALSDPASREKTVYPDHEDCDCAFKVTNGTAAVSPHHVDVLIK